MVSSDEGFSVEVLGRTGIEYREGGKLMFADSEVLAVGHGIMVIKDSIRAWWPPNEKEQVAAKQRQRIVENIRRAIAFRKEPVEIVQVSLPAPRKGLRCQTSMKPF